MTCLSVLSSITGTFLGNFRFQPKFCNGCHDMTQKSMSFNDVEIVTVERDDYLIHFWNMTKSETMN